jgi:phosphoserine aminotransferase
VYNFSPGPAALPLEVLEQAQREMVEWGASGMSVMEMSHRGKDFIGIAERAEHDLRELMDIPANYKVLFLQGGAALQFAMVPLNLLGDRRKADYLVSGYWSKKAVAEAKRFAQVNIVASGEAGKFAAIPPRETWRLDPEAGYVHYTPNETIGGVEFHFTPEAGDAPLVADASSMILSRPMDVSRFGVIYAGAQKNVGPAGVTIVIVRDDLLGRTAAAAPSLFDYKTQAENQSMLNTCPTYAWYVAGLVFQWLKRQGGVAAIEKVNVRKAEKLYAAIDGSGGFYRNPVDPSCRSRMNIPFTLVDDKLDEPFLKESKAAGLVALKGHRVVGGMRASIYNAMPEAGVDALIAFMKDFQQRRG